MIQTHLLKAEPPYQIISAAGQVGIQVATLIVTEDKSTEEGYQIDTHSHPVVNYGLKTLEENEEETHSLGFAEFVSPLQPEGAVWNKVEVSDVQVIGLAGITHKISLSNYCKLVPPSSIGHGKPVGPVWDKHSVDCVFGLRWGVSRVGIELMTIKDDEFKKDENGHIIVTLRSDCPANVPPLVMVEIPPQRSGFNGMSFLFSLFGNDGTDDISQCAANITQVLAALFTFFTICKGVVVSPMSKTDKYFKQLQQIAEMVNKEVMIYF